METKMSLSEDQVKNLITSGNNTLKDSLSPQIQELSNKLVRIETKQENYLDFVKHVSGGIKDNENRIRALEPLTGSLDMIEKMSKSLSEISTKITKLEDVPKKLDGLVSKEEFYKTVKDIETDIARITAEHEKNTELRKNMVFLIAFLLVVIPLMMKGFDYISK